MTIETIKVIHYLASNTVVHRGKEYEGIYGFLDAIGYGDSPYYLASKIVFSTNDETVDIVEATIKVDTNIL